MSRYIDADAVKVRYRGGFHDDYVVDYDSFMKAPSIEIPTWIPCSERLPEGSDEISECEMVLMTLSFGYVACGWIYSDTAYVLINNPVYDQIVIADRKDVLAWMPLPKPWEGASNE